LLLIGFSITRMANKSKFQAIKGTRDLLPPETGLWSHVEQTAHSVFGTFGFGEIRPPIFEPTELFARSIGLDLLTSFRRKCIRSKIATIVR
jgi:histidyl-tRNA synthetase